MMSLRIALASVAMFCLLPFFQPTARGADWPQWRGPFRTGHVPADEQMPEKLPDQPKVIWRMKVGEGLASPVVAGGTAYYFDAVEKKETLHAIDALTAKEIWRAA